jgi:hypothetical protein
MKLPCYRHALAMLLPCSCHVIAMLLSCSCHALVVMFWSCSCLALPPPPQTNHSHVAALSSCCPYAFDALGQSI